MQAHGRGVYEPYDREAARLLERGRDEKDARLLDEVCRAFPVARVVPDALLALGSLHESSRRWTEAAHAYKRLLLIAPDDELRPRRSGGWRTCTKREALPVGPGQLPGVAGAVSTIELKEPGGCGDGRRVGRGRAGAAPIRPADRRSSGAPDAGPAGSPLALAGPRRPAAPGDRARTGVAPSLDAGRLFLVEKTGLRLLDPATRLAAVVGRAGSAGRLGRLSRR